MDLVGLREVLHQVSASSKVIDFRAPEDSDSEEEDMDLDGSAGMDLLDKNLEAFKLAGIALSLAAGGLLAGYLGAFTPRSLSLGEDPLFLVFRSLTALVALLCFLFVVRWRQAVDAQNHALNAMNANIQEQIVQVDSGALISLVERSRAPLKVIAGKYVGGGAPEILERMRKGQAPTSTGATEGSARQVLGQAEFSSRALVGTSPRSRFQL